MSELEQLTLLFEEYVDSSDNPDINFDIALEYERLGQRASAITFFLRAAEYGYESAPNIVYVSLLRVGLNLEALTNRDFAVSNSYLHALAYQPNRPEAYFLLSRHYEHTKAWQESYTLAIMGQQYSQFRPEPTLADVEYRGLYCLIFQQAVAAWWVGRKDEAKSLFQNLLEHHEMESKYVESCKSNLQLWNS